MLVSIILFLRSSNRSSSSRRIELHPFVIATFGFEVLFFCFNLFPRFFLVRTIVTTIVLTFVVQLGILFSSFFRKPDEVILHVVVTMTAAIATAATAGSREERPKGMDETSHDIAALISRRTDGDAGGNLRIRFRIVRKRKANIRHLGSRTVEEGVGTVIHLVVENSKKKCEEPKGQKCQTMRNMKTNTSVSRLI